MLQKTLIFVAIAVRSSHSLQTFVSFRHRKSSMHLFYVSDFQPYSYYPTNFRTTLTTNETLTLNGDKLSCSMPNGGGGGRRVSRYKFLSPDGLQGGPGPRARLRSLFFIFFGGILIWRLCKLTLRDQVQVPLRMRIILSEFV